ncbi:MAG: hypothetical protein PSY12_08650 [bacterium]|nr:hypothetical protein [bacterium]
MYKAFAIATLIAAPLIVMATQAFLPTAHHAALQDQAAAVRPDVPPPPVPVPVAPPVAQPMAPSTDSSNFGQPVSDAATPAVGLEGVPPAAATQFADPGVAPPGSPNAEP